MIINGTFSLVIFNGAGWLVTQITQKVINVRLSVDVLSIIVYGEDKVFELEKHITTQYEQSKVNVDMMSLREDRAPGTLCLSFMS